jgi:aspartate aminotransferase-like enzyme
MAEMVRAWGQRAGFEFLAPAGYRSPTLTVFRNNLGVDFKAMNGFLRKRGMEIANGYGKLKDKTFRIAHMGDFQLGDVEELCGTLEEFLAQR